MKESFWRDKWAANEIGFHEGRPNDLLVRHLDRLGLTPGQRVLLPLCGKTNDIAWLLSKGFRVAGIELVETAIRQLFEELGIKPGITAVGQLKRYTAVDIDIFAGNIFDVDAGLLGAVDAIYDRAALVAMPGDIRPQYASHLAGLTNRANQLLVSFDYDQQAMKGPPFSVPEKELTEIYGEFYNLELLESQPLGGGLKGICPAQEQAWLLKSRELK